MHLTQPPPDIIMSNNDLISFSPVLFLVEILSKCAGIIVFDDIVVNIVVEAAIEGVVVEGAIEGVVVEGAIEGIVVVFKLSK